LKIDIDSEEQFRNFENAIQCIRRNHAFEFSVVYKVSRSGLPHQHITITLPFKVTPWQRIAWQAAMGSDPVRELLSAIRLQRGDILPTLFVEQPEISKCR
jgi:hypothetical protein